MDVTSPYTLALPSRLGEVYTGSLLGYVKELQGRVAEWAQGRWRPMWSSVLTGHFQHASGDLAMLTMYPSISAVAAHTRAPQKAAFRGEEVKASKHLLVGTPTHCCCIF